MKQAGAWRKVYPEPEGDIARISYDAGLIAEFDQGSVVPDGSRWRALASERWGAVGTVEEAHVVYYILLRLLEEVRSEPGKARARIEWQKIQPELVKLMGLEWEADPIRIFGVPRPFR
jgi:hypothetical protein